MFTLGEYAACVLVGFGLTALAMVTYAIGYLLKATGILVIRSLHARTAHPKLLPVKFGAGADTGPIIAEDRRS